MLSSPAHLLLCLFFFNDTATTEIYTLSLHDALPISPRDSRVESVSRPTNRTVQRRSRRSEEHTSELQSHHDLVCRLLLAKKENTSELQSRRELGFCLLSKTRNREIR